MEENQIDYKLVFFNSEMYIGKIMNIPILDSLFRISVFENKLHFLLYDSKYLYYSVQDFENITRYHKHENPSIEFNDIANLIEFLIEKIFKSEDKNRQIYQENNSFVFENFVNIIKIKWRFECDVITDYKLIYLVQSLFIKPLLNTILSIQNFFRDKPEISQNNNSHSKLYVGDLLPIIGMNLLSENYNFNRNMCCIIKESTINSNVLLLNKLEEKKKEKFKRKNSTKIKIKKEDISESSSLVGNLSNENSMNSVMVKKKSKSNKKLKFI